MRTATGVGRVRPNTLTAVIIFIGAGLSLDVAFGEPDNSRKSLAYFPLRLKIVLSPAAKSALSRQDETIIVAAEYFGHPTKAALAKKKNVPMGDEGVDLGSEKVELRGAGTATLTGAPIDRSLLQYIEGEVVQVNVNTYSGRRSSKDNLLHCSFYDGPAAIPREKSIHTHCRLISER